MLKVQKHAPDIDLSAKSTFRFGVDVNIMGGAIERLLVVDATSCSFKVFPLGFLCSDIVLMLLVGVIVCHLVGIEWDERR